MNINTPIHDFHLFTLCLDEFLKGLTWKTINPNYVCVPPGLTRNHMVPGEAS